MYRAKSICLLLLAALSVGAEEDEKAQSIADFDGEILPFVENYCIGCHQEDRAKGDLNIERFTTRDSVLDGLAVWQRIVKRIQANEMPPKDKKQPTAEEKEKFIAWVGSLKFDDADCNRIATEDSVAWYRGYVMSRRLNRNEYENTLQDLLNIDTPFAEMFPADGAGGEGFDTTGSALFLSAIQMEKYLQAADLAIETAIPKSDITEHPLILAFPQGELVPRDAAAHSIANFLTRAWRRPPTDDELNRHLELFDSGINNGDSYVDALKFTYKGILVSPNFMFLPEPEPDEVGTYQLGDFQLASRMSYFLWGTMPDDELFQLAHEGKLGTEEELRRQVKRMLRDPKARGLADLFASQWLGINQLGLTKQPDTSKFPEYNEQLNAYMREEASLFFTHILQEDRSLVELIDADHTFVNEELAKLYGLEGVYGEEFRRVALTDKNRGGIVSLPAVLTATSHPLRTSPVLRGLWVLETVLGEHVPPPPPNVPALPEDDKPVDGLSFREQMELHRTNQECASCHARMDPIGFGLDNFDPIGRWRGDLGGLAINAEGTLTSGENFNGPAELKAILVAKKDQVAHNITRKMLGYALGRELNRYDNCVIDDTMEALRASDYRASDLFTEIVLSYPFLHRYSGGAKEEEPKEES